MSASPFPQEDETEGSFEPRTNPWNQDPKPGAFAGLFHSDDYGYAAPLKNILAMPGSAAAKGELLLSVAMHGYVDLAADMSGGLTGTMSADQSGAAADAVEADAKNRLRALRPDPATTGIVLQTLHGLGEMASTMIMMAPAEAPSATALALGALEAPAAYQDELDQGVQGGTAAKLAALHGLFAGAGATLPMVFGKTLATRLLTGAASNVSFGTVGRAADSSILQNDGYPEMAEQQQVFDRSQMLVDLVMGLGFGGIHHLLSPTGMKEMPKIAEAMGKDSVMRDAALYAEVAIKERESGPGVPVTPGDMNAHVAAHDRALDNLESRERVNVAGTGVEDSTVIPRGGEENPEVQDMIHGALKEAGLYEALADRDNAQSLLERRLKGEPEAGLEPEPHPAYEPGTEPEAPAEPAAPKGSARDFVNRFEDENPQTPEVGFSGRMTEGGSVRMDLATDPFERGVVHLEAIQATETGKGAGSNAMRNLTAKADAAGIKLKLNAVPIGKGGPDTAKLMEFYGKHGFKADAEGTGETSMVREAQNPVKAAAEAVSVASKEAPTMFKAAVDCFMRQI